MLMLPAILEYSNENKILFKKELGKLKNSTSIPKNTLNILIQSTKNPYFQLFNV